jgi:sec-independent protein translocase protein TatA
VKGFKDGIKDGSANAGTDTAVPPSQQVGQQKAADPNTVDVEAKTKS